MARLAISTPAPTLSNERFFLRASIAMVLVIVAGFSLQLGMGRSSFSSPLLVHAHAVVFMGWVLIYLLQNTFIATGKVALHRPLGWIAAAWIFPMLVLGCMVTVAMVRQGHVPFFFRPLQFLVFDSLALFAFAGLTVAAIVLRRSTQWHRRLHYCGMAILLAPGFGRLLPMPLLQPWAWEATFAATMIFPLIGVVSDIRRNGRAHPAWGWGIAAMLGMAMATEAITYTPAGTAIYRGVVSGSAGADVPPLEFANPPVGPQRTGRVETK